MSSTALVHKPRRPFSAAWAALALSWSGGDERDPTGTCWAWSGKRYLEALRGVYPQAGLLEGIVMARRAAELGRLARTLTDTLPYAPELVDVTLAGDDALSAWVSWRIGGGAPVTVAFSVVGWRVQRWREWDAAQGDRPAPPDRRGWFLCSRPTPNGWGQEEAEIKDIARAELWVRCHWDRWCLEASIHHRVDEEERERQADERLAERQALEEKRRADEDRMRDLLEAYEEGSITDEEEAELEGLHETLYGCW